MKLPKVKKRLTDLLPSSDKLASRTNRVALGILMFTIGGFTSPAHSALPSTEPPSVFAEKKLQAAEKLVLKQPLVTSTLHAQHYSHYSHSSHDSHYSHTSHYSHYSSQ